MIKRLLKAITSFKHAPVHNKSGMKNGFWPIIAAFAKKAIAANIAAEATKDMEGPVKGLATKGIRGGGQDEGSALDEYLSGATDDLIEGIVADVVNEDLPALTQNSLNQQMGTPPSENYAMLDKIVQNQRLKQQSPEGLFGLGQGFGHGFIGKPPPEDPSVWQGLGRTFGSAMRSRLGAPTRSYSKDDSQENLQKAVYMQALGKIKEKEGFKGIQRFTKENLGNPGALEALKDYAKLEKTISGLAPEPKETSIEDFRKSLMEGDEDKKEAGKKTVIEPRATGLGRLGRGAAYEEAVTSYGEDTTDMILDKAMDLEKKGKSLAEISKMLKEAGYNPDLFLKFYR